MPGRSRFGVYASVLALSLLVVSIASARTEAAPLIRLRVATFDPVRGEPPLPAGLTLDGYPAGRPGPFLVQFAGPIRPAWRQAVQDAGARLLDYIPDYAFIAWMDQATRDKVSALPGVRWVGVFQPGYKIHPALMPALAPSPISPSRTGAATPVVVQTFPVDGAGKLKGVDSGPAVDGATVSTTVDNAGLIEMARRPEVAWIEPARARRLLNAPSREVMQVGTAWDHLGLFGQGQVVAVADSGLDVGTLDAEMSDDFEGRIAAAYAPHEVTELCTQTEWSDADGHGTHVAGSLLGSGTLSGSDPAARRYAGSLAGVAPEASLVVQAVFDHSGEPCFPSALGSLFGQAYDSGARIHSDSWGTSAAGEYDVDARQTDDFAWSHPDMTIVVAAGNDGADEDQDGVIDQSSITSPGTAKNVLTVGAGEGDRPPYTPIPPDSGGLANARWGDGGWAGSNGTTYYRADPIRSDFLSDNSGGVAAFSSRGPTADGRIKPDVVAPGTNIVSTRSHLSGAGEEWGAYNSDYVYAGGTSMATPLAAGAAALVRQFFVERAGIPNPSSALVKAALVNGATDLTPGQYGLGQADGPTVFFDDMENGETNWKPDPPWTRSFTAFFSPFNSWIDSPAGEYQNNVDTSLRLAGSLDLRGLDVPGLTFYHRHDLEYGYDYGRVEISTDGGATWSEVSRFTGRLYDWTRAQVRLSRFAGQPAVKVRFRLTSDESGRRDGWSIDDVAVGPWNAQEVRGRPDFAQGWGRVNLADSLAPSSPRAMWWDEHQAGLQTGEQIIYTDLPAQPLVVTTGALPLRITLVWTDPPASESAAAALVNDLDLVVEGPDGRVYYGNGGSEPDRVDNVEGVTLTRPARGPYTVRVIAANVPTGPQPYALVVTGPFIVLPPRAYLPVVRR